MPGAGRWTSSVVNVLLAVNIGAFVLMITVAPWIWDLGAMQSNLVARGQIWRLLTAQYLHAGAYHIAFNMLALYFLGRSLERLWGNRKFLVIYTLAGLIGNLFYLAACFLRPDMFDPRIPLVGASGCILGLLGVCAVLFPRAIVIVIMFPMTIRSAALLFTAIYVINVIQQGRNAGGDVCHLGGLAFGVLWAMYGETGRISLPRFLRMPRRGSGGRRPKVRHIPPPPVDQAAINRILEKIKVGGLANLTAAEKAALHEATQRERELDKRYGRVDRL